MAHEQVYPFIHRDIGDHIQKKDEIVQLLTGGDENKTVHPAYPEGYNVPGEIAFTLLNKKLLDKLRKLRVWNEDSDNDDDDTTGGICCLKDLEYFVQKIETRTKEKQHKLCTEGNNGGEYIFIYYHFLKQFSDRSFPETIPTFSGRSFPGTIPAHPVLNRKGRQKMEQCVKHFLSTLYQIVSVCKNSFVPIWKHSALPKQTYILDFNGLEYRPKKTKDLKEQYYELVLDLDPKRGGYAHKAREECKVKTASAKGGHQMGIRRFKAEKKDFVKSKMPPTLMAHYTSPSERENEICSKGKESPSTKTYPRACGRRDFEEYMDGNQKFDEFQGNVARKRMCALESERKKNDMDKVLTTGPNFFEYGNLVGYGLTNTTLTPQMEIGNTLCQIKDEENQIQEYKPEKMLLPRILCDMINSNNETENTRIAPKEFKMLGFFIGTVQEFDQKPHLDIGKEESSDFFFADMPLGSNGMSLNVWTSREYVNRQFPDFDEESRSTLCTYPICLELKYGECVLWQGDAIHGGGFFGVKEVCKETRDALRKMVEEKKPRPMYAFRVHLSLGTSKATNHALDGKFDVKRGNSGKAKLWKEMGLKGRLGPFRNN